MKADEREGGAAPRLLLTGRPGCGKTTVIRSTVTAIGPQHCVGFYTEEVREGRRRVGFDVVTLDEERAPLARVGAEGPRVSRYGVDVAGFERTALEPLEAAVAEPDGRVLIIDEIGKMELLSDRFVELLIRVFDPVITAPVLGTILRGRHDKIERMGGLARARRVLVTDENRAHLPRELARLYRDYLRRQLRGSRG